MGPVLVSKAFVSMLKEAAAQRSGTAKGLPPPTFLTVNSFGGRCGADNTCDNTTTYNSLRPLAATNWDIKWGLSSLE